MLRPKEVVSIIAGPNGVKDLESLEKPYYFFSMEDMAEYSPATISEALSQHPTIEVEPDSDKEELEYWDWEAVFRTDLGDARLTMTLFTDYFLSVNFDGECSKKEVLELMTYLKRNGFPYLWFVVGSGEMLTENAFDNRFSQYSELSLCSPS